MDASNFEGISAENVTDTPLSHRLLLLRALTGQVPAGRRRPGTLRGVSFRKATTMEFADSH
eukprot:scaffold609_cov170-Amphora_coffeaeformis.AAC.27